MLIVAAALWFNNDFLYDPTPPMGALSDHVGIMRGYRQTHSFSDTLTWWHGPWIHEHYPSLRPLSSYLMWLDVWVGENVGWMATAWITFFMLCAVCLMVAALAWCLSKSECVALLAGVLATHIAPQVPLLAGVGNGLPNHFYAVQDNYLAIAFTLASMCAFLKWRESDNRRHLATAWLCALAAFLSKELSYVLPAMLFALAVLPARVGRKRAALQSLLMLCLAASIFLFRAAVVQSPHDSAHRLQSLNIVMWQSYYHWAPATPYEVLFVVDFGAALYALLVYAGLGAALYYRRELMIVSRRHGVLLMQIAVLWCCVQLSYLPVMGYHFERFHGVPAGTHYVLPAVFLGCILTAVTVQLAARILRDIQRAVKLNLARSEVSGVDVVDVGIKLNVAICARCGHRDVVPERGSPAG